MVYSLLLCFAHTHTYIERIKVCLEPEIGPVTWPNSLVSYPFLFWLRHAMPSPWHAFALLILLTWIFTSHKPIFGLAKPFVLPHKMPKAPSCAQLWLRRPTPKSLDYPHSPDLQFILLVPAILLACKVCLSFRTITVTAVVVAIFAGSP